MDVEGWQVRTQLQSRPVETNSPPERACRRERDALDPEVWLPPGTKATGECPIMNNFLSHDETVWVASRI